MKRAIFIFIIIFQTNYSNGQAAENLPITKSEIKVFFSDTRHEINGDKTYFNVLDKPLKTMFPASRKELKRYLKMYRMDSFFVKSDIDLLLKQINATKNFTWDSTLIEKATFIEHRVKDSASRNKKDISGSGLKAHYSFSFPVFNRDKTLCYIQTHFWCGWLCGHHISYIFKFINNHWENYRVFYGPVS